MRLYRTLQGDMLDAICRAELGAEAHVPVVLDLNPGLAGLGPVYPAGLLITLPDRIAAPRVTQVRLWGRA